MEIKMIDGLYNNGLEKIEEHTGWYYSFDDYIELYEVEDFIKNGDFIKGNEISFFFYPECRVYTPFKKEYGVYYKSMCVKYYRESLYFIRADFNIWELQIYKYTPLEDSLEKIETFNMRELKLYNIRLELSPLMLVSEDDSNAQIYYPERISLKLEGNESFIFRVGEKFYFNKWVEEGIDEDDKITSDYKYYETYIVKDRNSNVIEKGLGYIERMPDGNWVIV